MLVLMIHVDHSTHGWLATLCLWHSWCFLGLGAFPFTHGFIQRNLQGALQQLETFAERIRRGLRQLQFQTVSLSKTKTGESCSHACMMFCIGLTYKVVSLYNEVMLEGLDQAFLYGAWPATLWWVSMFLLMDFKKEPCSICFFSFQAFYEGAM